ncbi:MAG: hypothetical protein WB239_09560 [Acidimicrobiia bacterium]
MVLVGVLLVVPMLLVGVQAVGYVRGKFNSEFWALPLDDKLDRVAVKKWEWWWVAVWELVGVFAMTAGMAGLAYLLSNEGEGVLAFVSLGTYLVALCCWVLGLIYQTAGMSRAAAERAESGATPSWIHPLSGMVYLAEGSWVIGSNLAFVPLGVAIIRADMPAVWAGWAAVALGGAIAVTVVAMRDGFPQMPLLVPLVVGVALLIAAF